MGFSDDDFEDFKQIKEDVKKNNILTKVRQIYNPITYEQCLEPTCSCHICSKGCSICLSTNDNCIYENLDCLLCVKEPSA